MSKTQGLEFEPETHELNLGTLLIPVLEKTGAGGSKGLSGWPALAIW